MTSEKFVTHKKGFLVSREDHSDQFMEWLGEQHMCDCSRCDRQQSALSEIASLKCQAPTLCSRGDPPRCCPCIARQAMSQG